MEQIILSVELTSVFQPEPTELDFHSRNNSFLVHSVQKLKCKKDKPWFHGGLLLDYFLAGISDYVESLQLLNSIMVMTRLQEVTATRQKIVHAWQVF